MHILNVMLSDGAGGLENAFVNYTQALRQMGRIVHCCIRQGAAIQPQLDTSIPVYKTAPAFELSPLLLWRAHRILTRAKPEIILVHGRRALRTFSVAKRLFGHRQPLVTVLHGPRFKHLRHADHVITVSAHLREQAIAHGLAADKVTHIPNFRVEPWQPAEPRALRTPPVVGVLGRLVPVKGVDLLIEALALLRHRGIMIPLVIGGAGTEEQALREHARIMGIADQVTWLGWIEDTKLFFDQIDIFCSPSRQEAFGLALLDAMRHAKVIVATRTDGARELLEPQAGGVLCDISAQALADALAQVIATPQAALQMATRAALRSEAYRFTTVMPQLDQCLRTTLAAACA